MNTEIVRKIIPAEVIEAVGRFILDKKCGNVVIHFDRGQIRKLNMDEAVRIK